jgi:hypothetical protein
MPSQKLQKYSPGVFLDHHPWTLQPTTHLSYIRSTHSPSHRPFITMACSLTPQPGSTVPKPYHNGELDILWRMCYSAVFSGIPPGQSFDYVIPINSSGQWGSYWTHAHASVCQLAVTWIQLRGLISLNRVNMLMASERPLLSTLQRRSIPTIPNIPLF